MPIPGFPVLGQIPDLPAALAARLQLSTFTPFSTVVAQAVTGAPVALPLPNNSIVYRRDAADGTPSTNTIDTLQIGVNSVVGRLGSGTSLVALTFSSLKANLNISAADLALPQNNIFLGDPTGKAAATPTTNVSLSAFGVPTGDIDINGHKLTGLADGVANTDAVTVEQLNTTIGTSAGYRDPEHATLNTGVMDLITLSFVPAYPAQTLAFLNMLALSYGIHYTITGNKLTATPALNVAYGGSGNDGAGFNSNFTITVLAR